jgi:hypothetical protein
MSPRWGVAVLSLVVASSAAETRATADMPVLRLVWLDPEGVASGTELSARAEVKSLLARLGANVTWRRGAPGEITRPDEVFVILIRAAVQGSDALVLGATRIRSSTSRVLWVRVANVAEAVGVSSYRPLRLQPPLEQRRVAIALGRVIAHELVHVLVPSLPHGRGLMAGMLARRELTGPSILVDAEVTLAFRAALRGEPVLAPPAATLAAEAVQLLQQDH